MRWRNLILRAVAQCVSGARCLSAAQAGLRVLTYHTIGGHAVNDYSNLNTISLAQFKSHLDALRGYQCVSLSETNLPTTQTKVAVTFDDGYVDNLYLAAPLLIEREMPFTVFVSTRFIRDRVHGFLSPPELRELASFPGVSIGSHGDTHCDLTLCDNQRLHAELVNSKAYLEDLLGRSIPSMAYPYGAANRRVRDAAEVCGYSVAACSYFDLNRPGRDPLMMNRLVMLNGDTKRVLIQKIRGDWDWYRWRMIDPLKL